MRLTAANRHGPRLWPKIRQSCVAAIAPRHLYIHAPLDDDNFRVASAKRCVEAAATVYRLLGAGDRIVAVYPPGGHGFPPEAREEAYRFIESVLGK